MSSKSYSASEAIDARMAIEGGTGQAIAAKADVMQPSGLGLAAKEYSNINQAWENVTLGMSGPEVRELIVGQAQGAAAGQQAVAQLATTAVQALSQAKTGDIAQTGYERYIPLLILGGIALAMVGVRRQRT